jgi:methoxymalonate biosynthesis protein
VTRPGDLEASGVAATPNPASADHVTAQSSTSSPGSPDSHVGITGAASGQSASSGAALSVAAEAGGIAGEGRADGGEAKSHSGRAGDGIGEVGAEAPGAGGPGGGSGGPPGAAGEGGVRAVVKCVVWDVDHTLLDGVFLEADGEPPGADPAMVAVLAELSGRGILHAIASRNPPAVAEHVARVTGTAFAAAECGWDAKSDSIGRIADTLGIGTDAIAFVDDDPYERAEVSFARPEVMVLAPEEMTSAPGWPEFSPAVVTAEAARRSQLYLDRQRRQAAEREFGGSREEFLRWCQTEITIGPAALADADRLAELSARTHQFNSAARALPAAGFAELIGAGEATGDAARVAAVRLRDRFGDDGLVGTCVTEDGPDGWTVTLLAMSCRAMGRGVIDALLAWLIEAAVRAGVRTLAIPAILTPRNVPLRLALAAAGFRASEAEPAWGSAGEGGQRRAVFRRAVDAGEAASPAGAAGAAGAIGADGEAAAGDVLNADEAGDGG